MGARRIKLDVMASPKGALTCVPAGVAGWGTPVCMGVPFCAPWALWALWALRKAWAWSPACRIWALGLNKGREAWRCLMDCGCILPGEAGLVGPQHSTDSWLLVWERGSPSRSQDRSHIGSNNTRQIQKTTLFQGPGYLKLFTLIQKSLVGLHLSSGEKSPSVQLPRA